MQTNRGHFIVKSKQSSFTLHLENALLKKRILSVYVHCKETKAGELNYLHIWAKNSYSVLDMSQILLIECLHFMSWIRTRNDLEISPGYKITCITEVLYEISKRILLYIADRSKGSMKTPSGEIAMDFCSNGSGEAASMLDQAMDAV